MPFDRQAEYQATLDNLIRMARDQGWKQYAWRQAQELDAERSGLFCGIAADLRRAMLATSGPDSAAGSADQTPTKPD